MGFRICVACSRHVKDSDAACPFCGASIGDAKRAGNPGRFANTRWAIMFGASTALAVGLAPTACSDSSSSGGPLPAYGAPIYSTDAAYGGPEIEDAHFGVDAAYGGPPTDAGPDSGASDAGASDANASDAGSD